MGQYRQWLHYRQVDQQLHTLKDHLSTELLRIHEQNSAVIPSLDTNNSVIQALLLSAQKSSLPSLTHLKEQQGTFTPTQQSDTISLLFERSRLPNLEPLFTNEVEQFQSTTQPTNPHSSLPPLPQPQYMQSADVSKLLDGQQQTEPQTALPWWLRKAALAAPGNGLDQQNIRTNRLVQRWLERWGRQENIDQEVTNGNGHQLTAPEEETKQ